MSVSLSLYGDEHHYNNEWMRDLFYTPVKKWNLSVVILLKSKGPIHDQFYGQYFNIVQSYWACMGDIDAKNPLYNYWYQ